MKPNSTYQRVNNKSFRNNAESSFFKVAFYDAFNSYITNQWCFLHTDTHLYYAIKIDIIFKKIWKGL